MKNKIWNALLKKEDTNVNQIVVKVEGRRDMKPSNDMEYPEAQCRAMPQLQGPEPKDDFPPLPLLDFPTLTAEDSRRRLRNEDMLSTIVTERPVASRIVQEAQGSYWKDNMVD
jgi:hypothetical protein